MHDEPEEIDIEEVIVDRASLLSAAANVRSVAMLTGTHGVVAPPLEQPRVRTPLPTELVKEGMALTGANEDADLVALLRARVLSAESASDVVTVLRTRLELAQAKIEQGDLPGAELEAEAAARAVFHAPAAHALLRTLRSDRARVKEQLEHVDHSLKHVSDSAVRADFLAEKGRLLEAAGRPAVECARVYVEALALVPNQAAALFGAEATLDAAASWEDLAGHLAKLAGLASSPAIGGWLLVERALLLDRRLGDHAGARAALLRAIELCPGLGPVREACVDYATSHRDDGWLAELLESEAALESDKVRAARLELDAALALLRAGGDRAHAVRLLERAYGRAPTSNLVDTRVAEELAALHEASGRFGDALRVKKSVLRSGAEPREEVGALRVLAVLAERAGDLGDAILLLERARVLEADDPSLLGELDRLLVGAQRHEARAVLWVREAARAEDSAEKARAFLVAAEAARASAKRLDAERYLQSAWMAAPDAPGTFDAVCERLPKMSSKDGVAERVKLYEQAAHSAAGDKRIYYLEKIAWLWDDVALEPAYAAKVYEAVLAIEPTRASAIAGLLSAATRAGDGRGRARALLAEAEASNDRARKGEARLLAAEALGDCDPERALVLANELSSHEDVGGRAAELVTSLHSRAGRWELAQESLVERSRKEKRPARKVALGLAAVEILSHRLGAPDKALAVLETLRQDAPGDLALAHATLACLVAHGNDVTTCETLVALARTETSATSRAARLVRAAEIRERTGSDAEAVDLYGQALDALPKDAWIVDRLVRIGARTPMGAVTVSPFLKALRAIDTEAANDDDGLIEGLLAPPANVAALRLAERFARRARSAPQLANALALAAETSDAVMALRALSGVTALVRFTLPETRDVAPWAKMLSLGSRDAVMLDTLVLRARALVSEGDAHAIEISVEATKRRLETAADDTERIALLLELARLHGRRDARREAASACRNALALGGASVSAAYLLAGHARELGDRRAAIEAATAFAEVTVDKPARAELLREAADLSLAEGDAESSASLLERALEANPDSVVIAARLAQVQSSRGAYRELAKVLRRCMYAARSSDAIVPMASELADVAKTKLSDPLLAIEALERARAASNGHVASLFLLAELYVGQRSWATALDMLGEVTVHSTEKDEKIVAYCGRASILSRVLDQTEKAEKELREALAIDAHDARVIRALLRLGIRMPPEERAELLSRGVGSETVKAERQALLLELAALRRDLGDSAGSEGALVEAAALSPNAAMLARVKETFGSDLEGTARVLGRTLSRVRESGATASAAWLVGLGQVELGLKRFDAAIERFEETLELEPSHAVARLALARAFAAKGRHETAAAALFPLVENGAAIDVNFIRLLEDSLANAGRTQQAWVAREVRALAGELDVDGIASLDSRRMMPATNSESLSPSSLRGFVMPPGLKRHPVWELSSVTHGIAGKLCRVSLSDQGASSKDRVKPKAMHPLRPLFDRMANAFEIFDVELAVSDHIAAPVVAVEDVTWIVVPSSLAEWPEATAVAALVRPLCRIALGVPWFGALPVEEVLAILIAIARQVTPSFSASPPKVVEALVGSYENAAKRALDRKKRRALEDLEPALRAAPPIPVEAFADAVARTEARAAFLLSGDLRASVKALASADPALADSVRRPSAGGLSAILGNAVGRDLVAFALGGDATALRRSLGTLHR